MIPRHVTCYRQNADIINRPMECKIFQLLDYHGKLRVCIASVEVGLFPRPVSGNSILEGQAHGISERKYHSMTCLGCYFVYPQSHALVVSRLFLQHSFTFVHLPNARCVFPGSFRTPFRSIQLRAFPSPLTTNDFVPKCLRLHDPSPD